VNGPLARFRDAGRLRRVDTALAEWVQRSFPGAGDEAMVAAALAARAVADGHSALALDRAQVWLDRLEATGKSVELPAVAGWYDALQRSSAVHAAASEVPVCSPLVLDPQRRVYLRRYYDYERRLANALVARASLPGSGGSFPDSRPPVLRSESPALGAGPQDPTRAESHRAVDAALSHRLTLITGGPGTGKTHSVIGLLLALVAQARIDGQTLRIALAAPTGKAAARLRHSVQAQMEALQPPAEIAAQIPAEAYTVHRLIGLSPQTLQARHHRDAPLPFDVVIVDEVSMVDLPLMTKLVDAVAESARLILLGDPGQLAAVEAGDVLGALVAAARESPLRACHVRLTSSYRFGQDSALGALARAIGAGEFQAALRAFERGPEVTCDATARTQDIIDAAARAYRLVLDATGPASALKASQEFRVLTALRRGPRGCTTIDRAIAAALQRRVGVRDGEHWWRGRLILVTVNRPKLGLFNGDTGVIWPDADGRTKAWFEGSNGAPRALSPAALPPHEGAFALTVHKAQGSEFQNVALVTGPPSSVLTRELLYTGVTRARTGITVYTDSDALRAGIGNPTLRMSGLLDRLHEAAQRAPEAGPTRRGQSRF
jgi:exodeoxyribonuclease V alpha subunit